MQCTRFVCVELVSSRRESLLLSLFETIEASATQNKIVPFVLTLIINSSLNLSRRQLFVPDTSSREVSLEVGIETNEYYKLLFYNGILTVIIISFNLRNSIFATFFKFFAGLNPICTCYIRIKKAQ